MKSVFPFLFIFGLYPVGAVCSEVFTEAQLKTIRAMIESAKQEVRRELLEEYRARGHLAARAATGDAMPGTPARLLTDTTSTRQVYYDRSEVAGSDVADGRLLVSKKIRSKYLEDPWGYATPQDRIFSDGRTAFQIETGTESDTASFRIGARKGYGLYSDKRVTRHSFHKWSATVTAPISKDDNKTATVATLDGLRNAFTFGLNFSWFLGGESRSPLSEDGFNYTREFINFCKANGISVREQIDITDPNALKDAIDGKRKNQCIDSAAVFKVLSDAGQKSKYEDYMTFFENPDQWKWAIGLSGRLGYEEFEFIESSNREMETRNETPWSFGFHVGAIPARFTSALVAGYQYQRSYSESELGAFCPGSGGETVACVTGKAGPPDEEEKHILYLEARTVTWKNNEAFGGLFRKIGLTVRFSHDFENDDSGVDVPVFLLFDEKSVINGGFRVGWTNTDQGSFGLFLGRPFSIYGGLTD